MRSCKIPNLHRHPMPETCPFWREVEKTVIGSQMQPDGKLLFCVLSHSCLCQTPHRKVTEIHKLQKSHEIWSEKVCELCHCPLTMAETGWPFLAGAQDLSPYLAGRPTSWSRLAPRGRFPPCSLSRILENALLFRILSLLCRNSVLPLGFLGTLWAPPPLPHRCRGSTAPGPDPAPRHPLLPSLQVSTACPQCVVWKKDKN